MEWKHSNSCRTHDEQPVNIYCNGKIPSKIPGSETISGWDYHENLIVSSLTHMPPFH